MGNKKLECNHDYASKIQNASDARTQFMKLSSKERTTVPNKQNTKPIKRYSCVEIYRDFCLQYIKDPSKISLACKQSLNFKYIFIILQAYQSSSSHLQTLNQLTLEGSTKPTERYHPSTIDTTQEQHLGHSQLQTLQSNFGKLQKEINKHTRKIREMVVEHKHHIMKVHF